MSASLYTGQQRQRGDEEEEEEEELNEEKQIDIDVALVIIQSELQEFYSNEKSNISNKALAQRKRVLENVLKSIGKNVTSSSRASFIEKEEEEEEKHLLLQNLISLLQVPKVKETEELLLATNDTILILLKEVNVIRNGTRTMDIDSSFLGFAFSSLLELASGGKTNANHQKICRFSHLVLAKLFY